MVTQYLILNNDDLNHILTTEQQNLMLNNDAENLGLTVEGLILFMNPNTLNYKALVNDVLYQVIPFGKRLETPAKYVIVDDKPTEDITPEYAQFKEDQLNVLGSVFQLLELPDFKEFMKLNTYENEV